MNNIVVRALSGAVFVSIVIGSLYYDKYSALACLSAFALLGLIEFYKLFSKSEKVSVSPELGTLGGMLILVLFSLVNLRLLHTKYLIVLVPLMFLLMLTELWRKKANPLLNLGVLFLGILYVAVPFTIMGFIDRNVLIFMFLLIWSNDTFAYLTGRMVGRTKLFERISPNKTWEGTIGGIVITLAVGALIAYFNGKSYVFWMPAAFIIALSAIFGDLLESLFKRSLNIKDSGNIMPGHGGILDRFDAALFAAPFFFCWWTFYQYF